MTHEDYERAANHWKIKDASDEKMDRDTLLKEIEQYKNRITLVHWQPEAVNLSE